MYCKECGEENKDDAVFCKNCGSSLKDTPVTSQSSSGPESRPKSPTLALIFGWAAGMLFLISGIAFISAGGLVAGAALVIASIILIPPALKLLESRSNRKLSGGVRIVLVLVLFVTYAVTLPPDLLEENLISDVDEDNGQLPKPDPYSMDHHETETHDSTPQYYTIGQPVVVGDLSYTVNNVYSASTVGDSYFTEQAQGIFIIVEMTIENTGPEVIDFNSIYLTIYDGPGQAYESDAGATLFIEDGILSGQLGPGLFAEGSVVFDVTPGEELYLEVTEGFGGDEVEWIELGGV